MKSVENCKTLKYFNTCLKCNDGYFVGSDGGCVINPLTKISDCFQYSNATTCITCMAGYYLTANTCLKQELISKTLRLCWRMMAGDEYEAIWK